jgi:hypothetical protein
MPLRFYRRFRAGPFRLNVSKSGRSFLTFPNRAKMPK